MSTNNKFAKHLILLLILSANFSSCEKEENNPEKHRLSKILYFIKSTDAKPTDGIEYTYDEAGNMVNESFFKYNPTELYQYREYEYSDKQKIKMRTFVKGDDGFKLFRIIDFKYENNQLIREEFRSEKGTLLCTMNYEYQGKNLTREYYFEPDYGISAEVKYTYDRQYRLTLEEHETTNVKDEKFIEYYYDSNDRKSKLVYYNLNREIIRSVEIVYNGRSKLPVKDVHYDKNGTPTHEYHHFYDKRGNHTETKLHEGCSLFKRQYDGGLLMEEILYQDPLKHRACQEEETIRYEYQKK